LSVLGVACAALVEKLGGVGPPVAARALAGAVGRGRPRVRRGVRLDGAHAGAVVGPVGWAIQPVARGTRTSWPLALALLLAVVTAARLAAWARRGNHRHGRTSCAPSRDGAVPRSLIQRALRRRKLTGVAGGRVASSGVPAAAAARPAAGRDMARRGRRLANLQRPGRAAVLAAAGALLCVLNARHPPQSPAAGSRSTFGASRLLEPLRSETDTPSRARVLMRAPDGRVLVDHTIVPSVVVLTAAKLAARAGADRGARSRTMARPIALMAIMVTPRSRSAARSTAAAAGGSRTACCRSPRPT